MIAEFYIAPQSFQHNANFSRQEIERKISQLARDITLIKKYRDTNKLFVHSSVYSIIFIGNLSLSDLLYDPTTGKQHLNRDEYNALQKIIIESKDTDISIQEVIDVLLPMHAEDICHGLIAFHQLANIQPDYQIVYNLNGWLAFRRHFLGLYPRDGNFFIDECKKYFPKLFFHDQNKVTINRILADCPKKIVFHLAALNDKFRESQENNRNRTEVLTHFSVNSQLDEHASLEGDPRRKPSLTFSFTNDNGQNEDICCEPHLKLCYNDAYPGDRSYSNDRRIYFYEGKGNVQNGNILIGHIGGHL